MKHLTAFALLALLGAGCSLVGDTRQESTLVGTWVTDQTPTAEAASKDQARLEYTLTFFEDGRFIDRVADVTYWVETSGTFSVAGNRLRFHPEALTTWDSFYGEDEPTVQRPYPYTDHRDNCTFVVVANTLTLTYLSYPADAPVTTKQSFRRKK